MYHYYRTAYHRSKTYIQLSLESRFIYPLFKAVNITHTLTKHTRSKKTSCLTFLFPVIFLNRGTVFDSFSTSGLLLGRRHKSMVAMDGSGATSLVACAGMEGARLCKAFLSSKNLAQKRNPANHPGTYKNL